LWADSKWVLGQMLLYSLFFLLASIVVVLSLARTNTRFFKYSHTSISFSRDMTSSLKYVKHKWGKTNWNGLKIQRWQRNKIGFQWNIDFNSSQSALRLCYVHNSSCPIFVLTTLAQHDPQASHHVPRELLFQAYIFAIYIDNEYECELRIQRLRNRSRNFTEDFNRIPFNKVKFYIFPKKGRGILFTLHPRGSLELDQFWLEDPKP